MLKPLKHKNSMEMCNLGSIWSNLNLSLSFDTEAALVRIMGSHCAKVMNEKSMSWDSLRRAARDV